ncbi:MAG: VOC family protein [bacterium]|nr:VOC family protein [bacterium]
MLGYVLQPPPAKHVSWEDWATSMGIPEENWNDVSALVDPDGNGLRVLFLRVPEAKSARNRVLLDVGGVRVGVVSQRAGILGRRAGSTGQRGVRSKRSGGVPLLGSGIPCQTSSSAVWFLEEWPMRIGARG